MKVIKFVVLLFLGIFVVALLGVGAAFYFTQNATETAEKFFQTVQAGNVDSAYELLSEEFKRTTSKEQLQTFLHENGLDSVVETSWTSRRIENSQGFLEGTVRTKSGGNIPLKIAFVKEKEAWLLFSIERPSSGLQQKSASEMKLKPPTEGEQVGLVRESMQQFALSLNDKSMKRFHGYISQLWAEQYSVEKLDEAYKALFSSGDDLTVLNRMPPIFSKPAAIDLNGVLRIAGYFPSRPMQVHFEQKFVREGTSWKCFGFHIRYQKAPAVESEQAIPGGEEGIKQEAVKEGS